MNSITNETNAVQIMSASLNSTHEDLTLFLFKLFIHTAFYYVGLLLPFGLLCNFLLLMVFVSPGVYRVSRSISRNISGLSLRDVSGQRRESVFSGIQLAENVVSVSRPVSSQRPVTVGATPSMRVYYAAIAWGELGTLVFKDAWWMWLAVGWPGILRLNALGPWNPADPEAPHWLCPLSLYLWYVHETLANNVFVLLQLERVVALYFPLRARAFLSTRSALKARIAVGCVAVGALLLCSTIFGFARVQPLGLVRHESLLHHASGIATDLIPMLGAECVFSSGISIWSDLGIIDYVANYLLPASMSIACSALIAAKIVQRRQRIIAAAAASPQLSAGEIYVCYFWRCT